MRAQRASHAVRDGFHVFLAASCALGPRLLGDVSHDECTAKNSNQTLPQFLLCVEAQENEAEARDNTPFSQSLQPAPGKRNIQKNMRFTMFFGPQEVPHS